MNYLNKHIIYTPEIITKTRGDPLHGVVIAEANTKLRIALNDGTELVVDKELCEISE